jgi:hypothetical protein
MLVQNSVIKIQQMNQEKSRFEMNPTKYVILKEEFPQNNQATEDKPVSANDQASTPEYYPNTKLDERTTQLEKNARDALRSRRNAGQEYPNDPIPYYGADYIKKFQSNLARDNLVVPVDLRDVSKTFPSPKNVRLLEAKLKSLIGCNQPNCDSPGVYDYDKRAYYDPTQLDTQNNIEYIKHTIDEMNASMRQSYQPDLMFVKDSLRPRIQNQKNSEREASNKFVADSYFYPVDRNKLANGTIVNNVSSNGFLVKSKYIDNDKNIIETADSIGEILGTKYVNSIPSMKEQSVPNIHLARPNEQKYNYADGKIIFNSGSIPQNVKTAVVYALGKVVTNGTDLLARVESSDKRQDSDSGDEAHLNLKKQQESTAPNTTPNAAAPKLEVISNTNTSENLAATPKLEAVTTSKTSTSEEKPKIQVNRNPETSSISNKPKIEAVIKITPSPSLVPSKSDENTVEKEAKKTESNLQTTSVLNAKVKEMDALKDTNTTQEKKTKEVPSKDVKLV